MRKFNSPSKFPHAKKLFAGLFKEFFHRRFCLFSKAWDPVGNRNEVFSGGYVVDHDWDPITWTEDQFGKALFYYEGRVVDSFVSVYT